MTSVNAVVGVPVAGGWGGVGTEVTFWLKQLVSDCTQISIPAIVDERIPLARALLVINRRMQVRVDGTRIGDPKVKSGAYSSQDGCHVVEGAIRLFSFHKRTTRRGRDWSVWNASRFGGGNVLNVLGEGIIFICHKYIK